MKTHAYGKRLCDPEDPVPDWFYRSFEVATSFATSRFRAVRSTLMSVAPPRVKRLAFWKTLASWADGLFGMISMASVRFIAKCVKCLFAAERFATRHTLRVVFQL